MSNTIDMFKTADLFLFCMCISVFEVMSHYLISTDWYKLEWPLSMSWESSTLLALHAHDTKFYGSVQMLCLSSFSWAAALGVNQFAIHSCERLACKGRFQPEKNIGDCQVYRNIFNQCKHGRPMQFMKYWKMEVFLLLV